MEGAGLAPGLSPHSPPQHEVGAVPTAPHGQKPPRGAGAGMEDWPPNVPQPRESPLPPVSSRSCAGWRVGYGQDGGDRYSQSPLEPVLVNMVPSDPEPPRGDSGRGSRGGGTRRSRRRTPGGAANPATRFHSRGPPVNGACASCGSHRSVTPSLPAWKGKCVLSGRFRLFGFFRRARAPYGKGMG